MKRNIQGVPQKEVDRIKEPPTEKQRIEAYLELNPASLFKEQLQQKLNRL